MRGYDEVQGVRLGTRGGVGVCMMEGRGFPSVMVAAGGSEKVFGERYFDSTTEEQRRMANVLSPRVRAFHRQE